ncbi:MAG: hypothetical protein KC589_03000 [Nanoarchaeota archaeon]|nr:hypothetical protein [Nanoarchaeota archaeon]
MRKKFKFPIKHFLIGLSILLLVLLSYNIVSHIDQDQIKESGKVVLFGYDLNVKERSLFLVSVIIGLLDGFNPCAMWVLIYLISLASTLKDKRKLILIVGTFVTTEAIMYFLVLAGWLNLFEFIGVSKWILYIVGAFALWSGAYSINDFIKKGGQITCEVGDLNSKRKTMNRIQDIVNSPITIASIFAIIVLAVVVNSIEFVCSAGLPAIFTQMLAIADISTLSKYFYILVYDIFFMIDDFIIFGLAFWALNSDWTSKYSGFSKLIGGIIMIIIGILLLFFPQFLL